MYYNYHGRLKQLLETEFYIVVPETGKFAYRFIFPRLMKEMPIRDYRMEEYEKYIRVDWYGHKMKININYCPMCGRELKNEISGSVFRRVR